MPDSYTLCAPEVSPQTIAEIVRVESGGNPLAININGLEEGPQSAAKSQKEATGIARKYIQSGYSVDMGLMQINSTNLGKLGIDLTNLDVLFTPCANVKAGGLLLEKFYQRAVQKFGHGQTALRATLSSYNTGNFSSGLKNGYVAKIYGRTPQTSLETALKSSTEINWRPPEGYYHFENKGEHIMTSDKKEEALVKQDVRKEALPPIEGIPTREELANIDMLERKLRLLDTVPGLSVQMDPDEAEALGAFEETAMSEEDAIEASTDPIIAE